MTPFPSSTFETFPSTTADSSPWTPYSRPPNPDFVTGYNLQPVPVPHVQQALTYERPRSSPSTFGPAEGLPWSDNALGIRYEAPEQSNTLGSTFTSVPYREARRPQEQVFTTPSPPEPQRFYPTLAPNPVGLVAKRRRDEEDEAALASSSKRRKRTPSASSVEALSEDDRFLLTLKEEDALPWKDIAARVSQRGKPVTVAASQMRYLRIRERLRAWEPVDIEALRLAHEWYEKCKWDIISQKVCIGQQT